MSEEIKEIIYDIKDSLNETPKKMYKYNKITFNLNELSEILKYVEQLEKELQTNANECKQLENIIKEAIVYVKDWQSFPHTNCTTHNELKNLLNILNEGGYNGK